MSPRPKRLRKISQPPVISGLKPYGFKTNPGKVKTAFLSYEEYEAIRLCDFEMLNHFQASVLMNVSRPTLTRIYADARHAVADAIISGKQLIIEGGKVYFDSDWFSCGHCGCFFTEPSGSMKVGACPLCGSSVISGFDQGQDDASEFLSKCEDVCICPECGHEQLHRFRKPCKSEICPQCGSAMCRNGAPHGKHFNNKT